MYRILLTIGLVLALCHTGCREDSDTLIAPPPDTVTLMTKDDSVVANAYIVRDAAEAFAAANNGMYAEEPWTEETLDGRTLIDFLPEGKLLVNPYTGLRSEPTPWGAAGAGQVGYRAFRSIEPHGYIIDAIGGNGYEYLIVLSWDPLEP